MAAAVFLLAILQTLGAWSFPLTDGTRQMTVSSHAVKWEDAFMDCPTGSQLASPDTSNLLKTLLEQKENETFWVENNKGNKAECSFVYHVKGKVLLEYSNNCEKKMRTMCMSSKLSDYSIFIYIAVGAFVISHIILITVCAVKVSAKRQKKALNKMLQNKDETKEKENGQKNEGAQKEDEKKRKKQEKKEKKDIERKEKERKEIEEKENRKKEKERKKNEMRTKEKEEKEEKEEQKKLAEEKGEKSDDNAEQDKVKQDQTGSEDVQNTEAKTASAEDSKETKTEEKKEKPSPVVTGQEATANSKSETDQELKEFPDPPDLGLNDLTTSLLVGTTAAIASTSADGAETSSTTEPPNENTTTLSTTETSATTEPDLVKSLVITDISMAVSDDVATSPTIAGLPSTPQSTLAAALPDPFTVSSSDTSGCQDMVAPVNITNPVLETLAPLDPFNSAANNAVEVVGDGVKPDGAPVGDDLPSTTIASSDSLLEVKMSSELETLLSEGGEATLLDFPLPPPDELDV